MKTPGKPISAGKKSEISKKKSPDNDSFNEFDDELDLDGFEDLEDLEDFDIEDDDDF